MANLELFPPTHIVGVFRGFREGGLEFHADLVLPYRNEFQNVPMHGQFLLVQLETPDDAVLGRITSLSAEGKLTSSSGEEFNIRAVRERREVPDDLREDYLRYRVNIRVLGVLRHHHGERLTFVASHRRLPHVGSPVAFPSGEVLREIAGHNIHGAGIGHFALGEYIYCEQPEAITVEPWMQFKTPDVTIKFPVESLVSRRSFVFARAGFGKSNLVKLLFSTLYATTPTVRKRAERDVPVGTLIFDPDGEYFWPDDKGRPGFADVPYLRDQLVVFTSRKNRGGYYQSFVAGGIKLDVRQLPPADVIAIALGPDRQDQQNVRKLASLSADRWEALVNLMAEKGYQAEIKEVADLLELDPIRQEVEALAARSNMMRIVGTLHDKSSQLLDMLFDALSKGKLCVVDVSQLRGGQALVLSGLILRRIFDRNQEQFTSADPQTIPTIAVVEEAQAVLNERALSAEPYIAWVKEGRKYDLGAVLITQQPGSIPGEILSQGDNWFIFHLLSANDLTSVRRANAHFSDGLLSVLLNEPIPGQGVFWSSVGGTPYPISLRAFSFEKRYSMHDPPYQLPAAQTFAAELRRAFEERVMRATPAVAATGNGRAGDMGTVSTPSFPGMHEAGDEEGQPVDVLALLEAQAIRTVWQDQGLVRKLETGLAWGTLRAKLRDALPATLDERDQRAYRLVRKALIERFGEEGVAWHSYKNVERQTTYVQLGRAPSV